ncbi:MULTISPECIES: hypothetical protein [unclassified Aeromicrobium]|uniref:hypothetical protein n=1 Tax=unclassified Aeromicrobium TaxID=2633570 RepID=UPI00396B30C7
MSDKTVRVQISDETAVETFYVLASSQAGAETEFQSWYDDEHIPEIMSKHAAIVGVERFDLGSPRIHGEVRETGSGVARSLAVYHVAGDARETWDGVRSGPALGRSAAIDYGQLRVAFSPA